MAILTDCHYDPLGYAGLRIAAARHPYTYRPFTELHLAPETHEQNG